MLKLTANTTSAQTSQTPIQQISTGHTDSTDEELTVAQELEKEICKPCHRVIKKGSINHWSLERPMVSGAGPAPNQAYTVALWRGL
ncbi:unnamed protein product [Parnassius apollo]|uniref:(apollo) hypothetical protein n=1 Tax=Parnassius apollo TaxID=110799 RepID=A0A8S3WG99_PARAO|nr:unnamed protein product [Parnassius apollo]